MVAAFPLSKLVTLLIRQVSRPIANMMKGRAKKSYIFRTYICMPPAQLYHWIEVRTRMWTLGLEQSTDVPKLNEAMAIELGGNMIGEGIIFGTAASILIYEYNRSANKDEAHEEEQHQRLSELNSRVEDLETTVTQQNAKIHEMLLQLGRVPVPSQPRSPAGDDS